MSAWFDVLPTWDIVGIFLVLLYLEKMSYLPIFESYLFASS